MEHMLKTVIFHLYICIQPYIFIDIFAVSCFDVEFADRDVEKRDQVILKHLITCTYI